MGPSTYATETILSPFQPFTVPFSSLKASHPRTPRGRDMINDSPPSSKNSPDLLLFPPHPPPTKLSTHQSKFTQKAYTGAFVSTIFHLEFPLSPDFIPPSRWYHRPHKDRPLPFAYDLQTGLAHARLPPVPSLLLSSRLPPLSLDSVDWCLIHDYSYSGPAGSKLICSISSSRIFSCTFPPSIRADSSHTLPTNRYEELMELERAPMDWSSRKRLQR